MHRGTPTRCAAETERLKDIHVKEKKKRKKRRIASTKYFHDTVKLIH